jgi:formylglycine-generating enzyme required for sulfatase activity
MPSGGPTQAVRGTRYFGAIGVGNPGRMARLREVPRDLGRMRGVFEDILGYERIPVPEEPTADMLREALRVWLDGTTFEPNDAVVLYYSGHGLVDGTVHYLGTRDANPDAIGSAFPSRELAAMVLRRRPAPGKVWIILDCCESGSGLANIREEMHARPGEYYGLASTGSFGPSFDGAFSRAFVAVTVGRPTDFSDQSVLAGELDAELRSRGRSPVQLFGATVSSEFDFLAGLSRAEVPPEMRTPTGLRGTSMMVPAVGASLVVATGLALHAFGRPASQGPVEAAGRDEDLAAETRPDAPPEMVVEPGGLAVPGMVVEPAGLAALGTDKATAQRMYDDCLATGEDCGKRSFEASVFARQVGWSAVVPVKTFALDTREVTRGEFAAWLDAQGARFKVAPDGTVRMNGGALLAKRASTGADAGTDRDPVRWVSWYGASAYCQDHGKRLPSETEWEFAARGTQGRSYPWGDTAPPATSVAYAAAQCRGGTCAPAPAGASAGDRTPEGVLDLAGSVSEWTASAFEGLTSEERQSCEEIHCRVVRGGTYHDPAVWLHGAIRRRYGAEETTGDLGFRCAAGGEP